MSQGQRGFGGVGFSRHGVGRELQFTAVEKAHQEGMEKLGEAIRIALHRGLFLGVVDFEGHFAVYPPGTFYKPHIDRHRETQDRIAKKTRASIKGWFRGGVL